MLVVTKIFELNFMGVFKGGTKKSLDIPEHI